MYTYTFIYYDMYEIEFSKITRNDLHYNLRLNNILLF